MSPTIGFALLLLTASISVFLPIFNYLSLRKPTNNLAELKHITFVLSSATFFCAILAQFCLIYSFLVSDYSVLNVYQNSHHFKPFIYKISGSWGNHEGSMLLLITIISGYSFAFAFLSKIDLKTKIIINSSQSLIIALLAIFTAFTSNPFARIFPTPTEGLGLNPLLQDIGLALHPPMLYTGYIGFALIFSFAIAGLLTEKVDKKFAQHLKNWLFFAYGFLTLGIGLGAWWAYRELGWGGYWFWDPVENISLMPWIAATALIHCLKILEKKEIFKIWTVFLGILTFILCLLGLFLVRSGILTSVHSFAVDATRGFFVIALIVIIGGGALLIFGAKMNTLLSNSQKMSFWSKSGAILTNNYFLMISLFVVLLGTIYPIFSRGLFDQFVSIGPSYYNKIFTILLMPFLAFLAISNQLTYSESATLKNAFAKKHLKGFLISFITSIILTSLTSLYHQKAEILQLIVLFLAIFSAAITLATKQKNMRMKIAHFGFCLIIIGIILTSSFGVVKEVNLQEQQSVTIGNYSLKFSSTHYTQGKNFFSREGKFDISKNGILIGSLTPQLRYYPTSKQTTNEASIRYGIFEDLYLVIGNKDDNENYAIRAYYKPFIYFIWLGCLLIFLAILSPIFLKKNHEN